MSEILAQVERDVKSGAKEITLLGQNVDSYKCPETGVSFADLLKNIAIVKIDPGQEKILIKKIGMHLESVKNIQSFMIPGSGISNYAGVSLR